MNDKLLETLKSILPESFGTTFVWIECSLSNILWFEKFKDTYKIIYQCEKCHEIHKNVMATDDDMNIIIQLSNNQYFHLFIYSVFNDKFISICLV